MATFSHGGELPNFISTGSGDNFGGGGLLGTLLALSLLGNRGGLFGNNNNCESPVTQVDLNAQTLGDIKAAIPFNEAQVQLALAQAVQGLTAQATANAISTVQGFANVSREVSAVDTNVDRQSTAIQMAIREDGQATRALITSNQIAELNQKLTVAQLENSEVRQSRERDRDSHNITMTMNNNQNQLQMQQQQQQQKIDLLTNYLCGISNQVARATNSSVVVGSSGVGTQQNANPTNVSA